jgi:hypothetical protein
MGGWHVYDRKKDAATLPEAFEPFVLCTPTVPRLHISFGIFYCSGLKSLIFMK